MHADDGGGCVSPGVLSDNMSDVLNDDTLILADANNNGEIKPEKYSLRPRSLRQKTEKGIELRKEIHTQRIRKSLEKTRPKNKPPPLSKYRRKTANARERNRMREINIAFETLRKAVPHLSNCEVSSNEKLTKITTLRLAMKYIQALRDAVDSTNSGPSQQLADFFNSDSDFDVLLSDGESLNLQSDISDSFASPDHSLTSPFSDPSDNSPGLSDHPELTDSGISAMTFTESGIDSNFELDTPLPEGDFCDDFLNSHCVGLS